METWATWSSWRGFWVSCSTTLGTGTGQIIRTTSVYKPHGFPVTFRLPSAAASSFISSSSSSSLVVALLHPRERQAAAPRCDGSSSVFNYRGGWEVCLSSDESMDERQRAERRRRLGLEEVTSNARARLLIGGTQPGGGWKAFLKTFVFFQRFVITSVFVLSFLSCRSL